MLKKTNGEKNKHVSSKRSKNELYSFLRLFLRGCYWTHPALLLLEDKC